MQRTSVINKDQNIDLITLANFEWWNEGIIEDKINEFQRQLILLWSLDTPCVEAADQKAYFTHTNLLQLVIFSYASDLEIKSKKDCVLSSDINHDQMSWSIKKMPSLLRDNTQTPGAYYLAISFGCDSTQRARIAELYNDHFPNQEQMVYFDKQCIEGNRNTLWGQSTAGDIKVYFRVDLFCKYVLEKLTDISQLVNLNACKETAAERINQERYWDYCKDNRME